MKLTIPKSTLSSALGAVSSVCGRALPILSFAKLTVEPNKTWLTTTDLDCRYEREISLKDQPSELGECLLPVARVKEWIGKVNGTEVSIQSEGQQVTLSTPESGPQKLSTEKVEDFPKMPSSEEQIFLAECDFSPIKHVAWSMIDASAGRPMLEAVFIEPETDGLICASSDGRKVGTVKFKAKRDEKPWVGIALPSKFVGIVAGLGECQLSESKNNLHFEGPSFNMVVRKTEDGIPPWRRSIYNSDFPVIGSITVMRDELAQDVSLCHLNHGADSGVRVTFSKSEEGMKVSYVADNKPDSYTHEITGMIKGEFPTIILGTVHIDPFFALPDESPLKIEFTGAKTVVHFSAPDIGVDYYFAPMYANEEKTA